MPFAVGGFLGELSPKKTHGETKSAPLHLRFYSPSCGACKKFAPSFESAARKGSNFTFARMAPWTKGGGSWNLGPVYGVLGGEE